MLIESLQNTCVNYSTASMTVASLYIAASDTVTNSLRWLMATLANYPQFQERAYAEIEDNLNKDGSVRKEKCHFVNALLLENLRMYPVSDSLPHLTTKDVMVGGFRIPTGSPVVASYTAVMHDPQNFANPAKFDPERYLTDGKFVHDPKVCAFGIGNRNCE